jgi:transcriptional regulator GlxA family with amidase domain
MNYLNQCRIERAQALLINTERQLKTEISLEVSGNIE